MKQTIIQIGNSEGVIIPKEYKQKLGVEKGSEIYLQMTPDGVLQLSSYPLTEYSVAPKFLSIVDKVNKKYKKTFQELAEK